MTWRSARVLVAIIAVYAVIIVLGDGPAGGPGRLLLLGYLLDAALRARGDDRRLLVWGVTALALAAAIISAVLAPQRVTSGYVGAASLLLTALVIVVMASTVVRRRQIDTLAVVGVLAVYLLLALLFASLNQLLAAFDPYHYLTGVAGLPTAADHLYFSVITLATVGFGDVTPASEPARAVTVVEALTGQLYLVSVVAIVVGAWHRD